MSIPASIRQALSRYTGDDHRWINAQLRGFEPRDQKLDSLIEQLDAAFALPHLHWHGVVYRGARGKFLRWLVEQDIGQGSILSDPGYASTSREFSVARSFAFAEPKGIVLRIRIAEGLPAISLAPYSNYPVEEEILLPRQAPLRVVGFSRQDRLLDTEYIQS